MKSFYLCFEVSDLEVAEEIVMAIRERTLQSVNLGRKESVDLADRMWMAAINAKKSVDRQREEQESNAE